ncbi:MAG: hypothetical protein EOR57_31400 [Mesorhizobium sp.]|uniref:hypothetical protein n=1 Tax=Mesorhizobium sp. TaxID=1871066 RepID=UPI000FE66FB5|nr:hypothetical protein [Mesorhizobium sp.]RWL14853.1 MAG: hypothetical protein EOR57_31400 [Mesorhizobium sp.]
MNTTQTATTKRGNPASAFLEASMASFSRTAFFVKSANEWRGLSRRKSVEGAAKAFARANMVAVIHRADDSAVGFFFDVANNRVAKVTYSNVEWSA